MTAICKNIGFEFSVSGGLSLVSGLVLEGLSGEIAKLVTALFSPNSSP